MKDRFNILVTGCGGDIGQSIGKILNGSRYVERLYGCDITNRNAARFIFSEFSIGEKCTSPDYFSTLADSVERKHIDIVIPASEQELRFFSENNIDSIGKAKLLMASPLAMQIGFDKLETALFLEKENLPFPVTKNVIDVNGNPELPFILKSKTGSGSSAIYKVEEVEDFEYLKRKNPTFIAQEYLSNDNGEYTCGVFRSKNNIIRNIIFKRTLMGGQSGYGEIIKNEEIENVLQSIAIKLELIGSINIQLRITNKGPVVFEINPRFSSTVLFRHLFGFKDIEWSIENLMNLAITEYIPPIEGKEFFKGYSEYVS